MNAIKFRLLIFLFLTFNAFGQQYSTIKNKNIKIKDMKKTDEYWKEKLDPEAFRILRQKGTEYPHTGDYNLHFQKGIYSCYACKEPLFESTSKFRSDCGWPSFDSAIDGKIRYEKDTSAGMIRTEIICNNCDGHLGHVFNDGPTDTGLRYCVNSISMDFKSENIKQ